MNLTKAQQETILNLETEDPEVITLQEQIKRNKRDPDPSIIYDLNSQNPNIRIKGSLKDVDREQALTLCRIKDSAIEGISQGRPFRGDERYISSEGRLLSNLRGKKSPPQTLLKQYPKFNKTHL